MTRQEIIQAIRKHGPSWALSLAIHLAILGPLCMITWVVAEAVTRDRVLSLAPPGAADGVAGAEGPAGEDPLSSGKGGGASAGGGSDAFAAGARNESLSLPAPAASKDLQDPSGSLRFGDAAAGSLSGDDAARGIIRSLSPLGPGPAGGWPWPPCPRTSCQAARD
ncbi:MAG: hypothetical protein ACE15C_08555 [Phycisphaerae bacterium]